MRVQNFLVCTLILFVSETPTDAKHGGGYELINGKIALKSVGADTGK